MKCYSLADYYFNHKHFIKLCFSSKGYAKLLHLFHIKYKNLSTNIPEVRLGGSSNGGKYSKLCSSVEGRIQKRMGMWVGKKELLSTHINLYC